MLHVVAVGSAESARTPSDLPEPLARQWQGLLPGFHRMVFEGGRVLLTVCIGDTQELMRQQVLQADEVTLHADAPLRSIARGLHRGTRLAIPRPGHVLPHELRQQGFVPDADDERAWIFDPAWEPRGLAPRIHTEAGRAAVIGGGLAGAAAAASLARRGWRVDVHDAAPLPASGASGLPTGLLAPHQSPDDNLLSRLSRAGVRMTLEEANALLATGRDWALTGVLERRLGDGRPPPHESEWTAREPGGDWWHARAAWISPAALVRAWLAQPGIRWRGTSAVRSARALANDYDIVVVAAALGSKALLDDALRLHPVRGQVTIGRRVPPSAPRHPVNGNGHFIPRGDLWLCGATYGRADASTEVRAADHAANLERLRALLPAVAGDLEADFASGAVEAWTGVRCASADRRPLVGPWEDRVWLSTAMGSRGLTFCVLAAELLAARLHGEPWPVEERLGLALDPSRQRGALTRSAAAARD